MMMLLCTFMFFLCFPLLCSELACKLACCLFAWHATTKQGMLHGGGEFVEWMNARHVLTSRVWIVPVVTDGQINNNMLKVGRFQINCKQVNKQAWADASWTNWWYGCGSTAESGRLQPSYNEITTTAPTYFVFQNIFSSFLLLLLSQLPRLGFHFVIIVIVLWFICCVFVFFFLLSNTLELV